MKREIKITIDCNDKTCGKCALRERYILSGISYCQVHLNSDGDSTQLNLSGKRKAYRCQACLDNECVEKGKP